MTSITIRNVAQETRDELAARAARSGRSLQEYLHALLTQTAAKPDIEATLRDIRSRKRAAPTEIPAGEILQHLEADRR